MGEGIGFPVPIYRFRGKSWRQIASRMSGHEGFAVTRHVHLELGPRVNRCAAMLKVFLLIAYFFDQLYIEKGYLRRTHSQGSSRLQMQHPVMGCNPLTSDPAGCMTNYTKVDKLPYCTQASAALMDSLKKANKTIHQERCEFFDEFDIQFDYGHQTTDFLIPTRRSIMTQNVDCDLSTSDPCPVKDALKLEETVYFADIEEFTLLIDHSMVNDELKVSNRAYDMIGFFNPCGRGKELEHESFSEKALERVSRYMEPQEVEVEEEDEKEELKCTFMPIHRVVKEHLSDDKRGARERGYAMWKEHWYNTILPIWPFGGDESQTAYKDPAPMGMLEGGDVIKIQDLLNLIGPEAALDKPFSRNRLEGMVIIIDIHYSNWKEHTWPNHVKPAYFYSFSVAPAEEYKVMQDRTRQVVMDRSGGKRILYDYHGIFVVVQQHGDIRVNSWAHVFLLIIGALIIESVYRSVFTLLILNFPGLTSASADETQIEELDDLISCEFKLGEKGGRDNDDKTGESVTEEESESSEHEYE